LVVSTYPPQQKDGIAEYTFHLVSAIQRTTGLDVSVLSPQKDWSCPLGFFLAIPRKAMSDGTAVVHYQFSYSAYGSTPNLILMPVQMALLRALLGKKVVCTIHDVVPASGLGRKFFEMYGGGSSGRQLWRVKKLLFCALTRLVGKVPSKIIVLNPLGKAALVDGYSFSDKKVVVIEHGIQQHLPVTPKPSSSAGDDGVKRKEKKEQDGDNDNDLYVTFYGLVKKGKGLDDLVEAWRTVCSHANNAKLQIVGGEHPYRKDGSLKALREKISLFGLNDNVTITGYIEDGELHRYFDRSCAFVFPYKEWGDVIFSSGALAKVLPYKRPVIVTDIPAFKPAIDAGSMLVCKRGDVDSIAENILCAINREERSLRAVQSMSHAIEEWSWENIAHRTVHLYLSLLVASANDDGDNDGDGGYKGGDKREGDDYGGDLHVAHGGYGNEHEHDLVSIALAGNGDGDDNNNDDGSGSSSSNINCNSRKNNNLRWCMECQTCCAVYCSLCGRRFMRDDQVVSGRSTGSSSLSLTTTSHLHPAMVAAEEATSPQL
jgi:glycosyltransferase involved in cell wall biosynthesis